MRCPVRLCLAGAVVMAAQAAWPETYPARPVHVISTFTPGSVADGAMRLLAQKLSDSMGQPVVVEAQPGAGGVLAAQNLLRSAPDGYTLLHASPSTLVAAPFLAKVPPYDPLKDFTYITHLMDASLCMLAGASLPVNNVKELVDYARANPGKLSYGSNGVGAGFHLEMELFKQYFGLQITHVPYRGGQEALNAAAAGQIPIAGAPTMSAAAQARTGHVKILAVLGTKRLDALPDVPSMLEQWPDYQKIPTGDEIVGPAGVPPEAVKRLNAEFIRALALPDVVERITKIGFVPGGNTPEEELEEIKRDMAVMQKGLKAARIEAQ